MANSTAYLCPACPECEDFTLPVVQSDYCPDGTNLEESEIKRIFLAELDSTDSSLPNNGPTDWSDPADWATAIDNAVAGQVRSLHGIGDIPEPEDTEATVHDNNVVILNRTYTLNFSLLDSNQINYDAVRALQCGGQVRIWFETRGNYLYGGQNGILANIRRVTAPKERGADSFVNYNFEIVWSAKCEPERIASPFSAVEAE